LIFDIDNAATATGGSTHLLSDSDASAASVHPEGRQYVQPGTVFETENICPGICLALLVIVADAKLP
jgi:hypothetical protein